MKERMMGLALLAGLALSGCAEQPAETPPEARAMPKLVEAPPEPAAHGPGDGHNHGPGDGHDHGPGDGHDHGSGDGHEHAGADHAGADHAGADHGPGGGKGDGKSHPQDATRHGYSADGKPVPHDPQGGDAAHTQAPRAAAPPEVPAAEDAPTPLISRVPPPPPGVPAVEAAPSVAAPASPSAAPASPSAASASPSGASATGK